MADSGRKSASSLFSSPKLFTCFSRKSFSDPDSLMSPTSILDSKSFSSALKNPFWSDSPRIPVPPENNNNNKVPGPVGLGLVVDASPSPLTQENSDHFPIVLFGSQLKIQIPLLLPSSSSLDSPISPDDFGIKTSKNNNNNSRPFSPVFSPSSAKKSSPFGSLNSGMESSNSPHRNFSSLSISEMELSEEYTRVISHGPNPKTTPIFDDCVVVHSSSSSSYGGGAGGTNNNNNHNLGTSENFLSFCYKCKKILGQGNDIYMYRGEKGFCSIECRDEEMIMEETMGIAEESDDF